jgi:hypothetical protein
MGTSRLSEARQGHFGPVWEEAISAEAFEHSLCHFAAQ